MAQVLKRGSGRRWFSAAVLLGLLALAVFLPPAAPVAAVVPGANGKIAFTHYVTSSSLTGDIYVMDADGSNLVQVTNLPGLEQGAAWSPDGRTIAFSTYDGSNTAVYLVDADGSNLRLLVTDGQWPTWSPDGSKLALMRCLFCEDIWVVNVDGTGLTKLTTNAERELWPDWSPDGTKIVYHRNNSAQIGDIWVMNADGSGQTNLTNSATNDVYAKWSPDGAKITFTSDFDIWVMHADGSSPVNLTNHPALDQYSSWSPDGTKLLFESRRTGFNQVYVMSSSGGNLAALTTTADHNASAAWQRVAPPVALSIEQLAQFDTAQVVNGVAVDGDYAYLASHTAGLLVINVADPRNPYKAGSLDTPDSANGVAIDGHYALVGDGYGDLRVINIADPTAPTETSHLDMPGYCCGMAVAGDDLYAGAGPAGLRIINIANKAAPLEVGFADTPDWAHNVAVNGDYAYVADGQDMRILNVANKTSPAAVGFVDTPGFARYVVLVDHHLYVADGYGGLRIFNTTNPAAPVEIASVGSLGYATGVAVEGDLAFVTGFYGQISVINIGTPSAPVKVAALQIPYILGGGLAVAGDILYVASDEGLLIFKVSPSACPAVPGNLLQNYCFEDGTSPWAFWTDGEGTYLTSSADPYQGRFAADVSIDQAGSNVQFYQKNIALKPNTKYELSLAAYSSNGNNLSVYLHKHDAPYTNYGLNNFVVDLTTGWKVYSTTFTTKGFTAPVDDARLRLWLAPYDANNMTYRIDWAVLREVNAANPPIPPDPGVIVPPPGQCNPPIVGNVIANPGFEDGKTGWAFYTDGAGSFATASADPYECTQNAQVSIGAQGTNVQLYQKDIAVQGGTPYLLRLAARSSGGQDVSLFLHKHDAPYTNYGLNGVQLDLTPAWQVFVVEFTAAGNVPLTDARLRLWLAPFDQNGASYEFDDVALLPKSTIAALSTPQMSDGLDSGNTQAASAGVAANSVQMQGYFLDGDEGGRLAGGYVPDNGPSWCYAARPSLSTLRPANGKLAKVTLRGLGSPRNLVITGIRQNEPVGPEPDGYGLGTAVATLRRERDATGEGRVYHIAFTATYQNRACNHEVVVTVPVDRRTAALDSGATFDSTMATGGAGR